MTKDEKKIINSLMKKAFKGDKEAYNTFLLRFYPYYYNFILGIVKQDVVAEDLTQETFLKLTKKDFRKTIFTDISSYIFQMAKNSCNDYFRENKRFNQYILSIEHTKSGTIITDCANYSFDEIFEGLSEIEDQLVRLRYIHDYKVSEIADAVGISSWKLKKEYEAILYKIRRNLEKRNDKKN